MTIILAITTILCLAVSIACLRLAGDTKTMRLRWMDMLGVMEVDLDRDLRKAQERQCSLMLMLLFAFFLSVSGSCLYWTIIEVQETRRDKTTIERELEMGRAEVEKMRQRFSR